MKRRAPLRRTNRTRRAANWTRAYGSPERVAWLQAQGCLVCGAVPSDAAHTASGGMGRKADAATCVPLCRTHHRALHQQGAATFQRTHGLDLSRAAERIARAWAQHQTA